MIPATCTPYRTALGAYVLGALDPTERAAVEEHIAACAECRNELSDLAGLPGLLGRLDAADAADVATVATPAPPELLDRLLAAAEAEATGHRRWRFVAAAAAIAVVLAGGAAVSAQLLGDDGGPGTVVVATDPASHVTARITATPRGWGTALQVRLGHAPRGATCSLVAVSESGERDIAASWHVGYSNGYVDVGGSTALPLSDIASYEVVTSEGRTLVHVSA